MEFFSLLNCSYIENFTKLKKERRLVVSWEVYHDTFFGDTKAVASNMFGDSMYSCYF